MDPSPCGPSPELGRRQEITVEYRRASAELIHNNQDTVSASETSSIKAETARRLTGSYKLPAHQPPCYTCIGC